GGEPSDAGSERECRGRKAHRNKLADQGIALAVLAAGLDDLYSGSRIVTKARELFRFDTIVRLVLCQVVQAVLGDGGGQVTRARLLIDTQAELILATDE